MSICENCKHLKREYSIVERKVCGKTGKVLQTKEELQEIRTRRKGEGLICYYARNANTVE